MPLTAGDTIPDVTLTTISADGPVPVRSTDVLGKGTVVLVAVPGAFTPTCSDHHLPGFVLRADELRAKGVDTIACVSVNDAFVMDAWGRALHTGDRILMLGDGNGELAEKFGLQLDGSAFGLGTRSRRYAAVLRDGVISSLEVEDSPLDVTVTSAESVLAKL